MQSFFVKIEESLSLQIPILPENNCTPRIPNTKRKSSRIITTYIRLGIDFNKLLTRTLIPIIKFTKKKKFCLTFIST
jgi:hypothetical protein